MKKFVAIILIMLIIISNATAEKAVVVGNDPVKNLFEIVVKMSDGNVYSYYDDVQIKMHTTLDVTIKNGEITNVIYQPDITIVIPVLILITILSIVFVTVDRRM